MSWIKDRFIYNSLEPQSFINRISVAVHLSKVDIMKIKHRFRKIEGTYNCYMLKLFDSYSYLFITDYKINLSAMEKEYEDRNSAYCVEGALFDLRTLKFVTFGKSKKDVFFKFMIYDAGIPHIVWNDEDNTFSVMFIFPDKKEEYGFLQTRDFPLTITHLNYDQVNDETFFTRTRAVFFKKSDKCGFIVLDELYLAKKVGNATFSECVVSSQLQDEINHAYFRENIKESGRSEFVDTELFSVDSKEMENHIIGGDSFVVTQDNSGLYGDKVFLLLNNDISYKRSRSCFAYEAHNIYTGKRKGHLTVTCSLAINDYDNEKIEYDITTRKVISKAKR